MGIYSEDVLGNMCWPLQHFPVPGECWNHDCRVGNRGGSPVFSAATFFLPFFLLCTLSSCIIGASHGSKSKTYGETNMHVLKFPSC